MSDAPPGVRPVQYVSVNGRSADSHLANGRSLRPIDGAVVEEALACISVNGTELATFMCSPFGLKPMALGFLANEGLISGLDDVHHVHISKNNTCVDVWLHDADLELPQRAIVTAGCGGGITFDDLSQKHEPLQSDFGATTGQLAGLMRQLHQGAALYQQARGIHTAVLAQNDEVLLQVEDIGRHNCLDKLRGAAMLAGLETKDKILLSSGRISSEMINKARQMQTPIVCSRTSPTSLSVALAQAWHITLVAYLRQDRMRIYTHKERVI